MTEETDNRKIFEAIEGKDGIRVTLESGATVSGWIGDDGIGWIFENQGVTERVALSFDALYAMFHIMGRLTESRWVTVENGGKLECHLPKS